MPNHFHILIQQASENGVREFISKLANSYTKYFNTKHNRVGPLFQGEFKAVLIEIDPRHARPQLAQHPRQEDLPRELVERLIVMRVAEKPADIFKERRAFAVRESHALKYNVALETKRPLPVIALAVFIRRTLQFLNPIRVRKCFLHRMH